MTFFDTETDKSYWFEQGKGYIMHAEIESDSDMVNNNRMADAETNQTIDDLTGLTIIDELPEVQDDYAFTLVEESPTEEELEWLEWMTEILEESCRGYC
jgi:SepF-like predicted cell division protein (DUF552 family)